MTHPADPATWFRVEPTPSVRVIEPQPEAVVEVAGMRHRDLVMINARLKRLCDARRGRYWHPLALLLLGAGFGAGFGGIPLSGTDDLAEWVLPVYWAAVGVTLLLGLICLLAARTTAAQQTESVVGIHEDLSLVLDAYKRPTTATPQPRAASGSASPHRE